MFEQTPHTHLMGSGCSDCNKSGYRRSDYVIQSKGRESILYIIKCYKENECFYKIGITFQGVVKRYKGTNSIPYNYEIINEYKCDAGCVWDLEREIHKKYRLYNYNPLLYFAGYTECFTLDLPVEEIITYLESIN